MKNFFRKLFRRDKSFNLNPSPLTIEGVGKAPMTPEPDDAEQAAGALLASLATTSHKAKAHKAEGKANEKGTPVYYKALAEKIAAAHQAEARAALRYVAFAEGVLAAPMRSVNLANLETGLFQRMDVINREGGELKRRWQHCLADVTVHLMGAVADEHAMDENIIGLPMKT